MADEIVFYTHPMSRGRTVRWMLEELGQPYRTELLDFGGSMRSADYLSINPLGKVPALRHGQMVVTETAAILAYLADAFPEAELAPPPGDPSRAPYYRWLFFAAGPFEAMVINNAMELVVPAGKERMAGFGSRSDMNDMLEQAVTANTYLAGDRFSAADLSVVSMLGWGMMAGAIERRPGFQQYCARMASRPAAIRARALDDALMPAKAE